jgi:hypothetical protein
MSPKQLCRLPGYVNFYADFITPADWVNNYQDTVNKYMADNSDDKLQVTNRDKPIGCVHLDYDRIWLDAQMDTQLIGQMMERNLQMFRDLNPNIQPGSVPSTLNYKPTPGGLKHSVTSMPRHLEAQPEGWAYNRVSTVCNTLAITYNYISCGGDSNMTTEDADRTYKLYSPPGLNRLIISNCQCRALELHLSEISAKEIFCDIYHYHGRNTYNVHPETELVVLYVTEKACSRIATVVMDNNPDYLVYIGKVTDSKYAIFIIRPSTMARLDHYLIRPVT